jgi:hypothetical protein
MLATVRARTRVSRRNDAGAIISRASVREITVGDTVEVYPGSTILDSCPAQGEAVALVLLPRPAR